MAEQSFPMTAEGKVKLEKELENLKLVKRPEVIERIKIARSYGDLSENSEYEAAKDEQSVVESRVKQIENMLKYAQVITVVVNTQILPDGTEPVNLFYFPAWLIVGAIAFAIIISLAAGLYPAARAARIDPVRALRHD